MSVDPAGKNRKVVGAFSGDDDCPWSDPLIDERDANSVRGDKKTAGLLHHATQAPFVEMESSWVQGRRPGVSPQRVVDEHGCRFLPGGGTARMN